VNIPRHPLWVDAYDGAWALLRQELAATGARSPREEAALSLYGRYAKPAVPAGWENDIAASPLATWAEWGRYLATGDRERLARLRPGLESGFGAFKAERQAGSGLCRGSAELEGMANTPREAGEWVDVSAQQALAAECLAGMGQALGLPEVERAYRAEWRALCERINRRCWDESLGFYVDCDARGERVGLKTAAGFWPMLAGAATPEQARRLAARLTDHDAFWRVHVAPSLPADHPRYADRGALWRGSVWSLESYALVKGLERFGLHALAARVADNHITTLSHVYKETQSHWDNYAPDYIEPGSIARPDSAAAGVSAVALLLETILGFRADAPGQALHWRPGLAETFAVEQLPVGDVLVDISVTANRDGACTASVRASGALRLHVVTAAGEQQVVLEAGQTNGIRIEYQVKHDA
jgi:hypothetical protein